MPVHQPATRHSTMAPVTSRVGLRHLTGAILPIGGLIATAALTASRLGYGDWLGGLGALAALIYIFALIVRLAREAPHAGDLPALEPRRWPRLGVWARLLFTVIVLSLLFFVGRWVNPTLLLVTVGGLISLGLILVRRSAMTRSLILTALLAGTLVFLGQSIMGQITGYTVFYLLTIPVLCVGGGLLVALTGLGRIRLAEGDLLGSLRGFLVGCVLALPPALLNISGGWQSRDTWVDRWWDPLAALTPGIAEETWARLFLVTLLYAVLRPGANKRPGVAMAGAILVAALVHALSHLPPQAILGPAGVMMTLTGLAYGVPMGLLFVKRDFAHAVGYHFFIDWVRFAAALVG